MGQSVSISASEAPENVLVTGDSMQTCTETARTIVRELAANDWTVFVHCIDPSQYDGVTTNYRIRETTIIDRKDLHEFSESCNGDKVAVVIDSVLSINRPLRAALANDKLTVILVSQVPAVQRGWRYDRVIRDGVEMASEQPTEGWFSWLW